MAEQESQINILDLVTPETNGENFKDIVAKFITLEDAKVFQGNLDLASQLVADSIAYLGPFAPYPATFRTEHLMAVAGFDISPEMAKKVIEIDIRLGAIKPAPEIGADRLSVSSEIIDLAKRQLLS